MIKNVEIIRWRKSYRLPGHLLWESYEGMSLDELKKKIISEHNEKYKGHTNSLCTDVFFYEEPSFGGIII